MGEGPSDADDAPISERDLQEAWAQAQVMSFNAPSHKRQKRDADGLGRGSGEPPIVVAQVAAAGAQTGREPTQAAKVAAAEQYVQELKLKFAALQEKLAYHQSRAGEVAEGMERVQKEITQWTLALVNARRAARPPATSWQPYTRPAPTSAFTRIPSGFAPPGPALPTAPHMNGFDAHQLHDPLQPVLNLLKQRLAAAGAHPTLPHQLQAPQSQQHQLQAVAVSSGPSAAAGAAGGRQLANGTLPGTTISPSPSFSNVLTAMAAGAPLPRAAHDELLKRLVDRLEELADGAQLRHRAGQSASDGGEGDNNGNDALIHAAAAVVQQAMHQDVKEEVETGNSS